MSTRRLIPSQFLSFQFGHLQYMMYKVAGIQGIQNKLSVLIKGPGWDPGKPWKGLAEDIPEVLSMLIYFKKYCKLKYSEASVIRTHVWELIMIIYIDRDSHIQIFSYPDSQLGNSVVWISEGLLYTASCHSYFYFKQWSVVCTRQTKCQIMTLISTR